ncbi:hypothetical protein CM49_04546 [Paenibacillus sp. P1XP2]|nr:hypothetical protein CM49_04546 [Paenibacillus sp. P1XP2]
MKGQRLRQLYRRLVSGSYRSIRAKLLVCFLIVA